MNRIAIISPDAPIEILDNLRKRDIEPVIMSRTDRVARPLSGHPDMQIFVHGGRVFCHPDIARPFLEKIEPHAKIVICPTRLAPDYPRDIPYNIACTGLAAFHHHASIDPLLAEHLKCQGISLRGVPQGYAKCSTLIVDDGSIITADESIRLAAIAAGLKALKIRPGFIGLPGYAFGFIGGATGRAGDMILCTGTLEHHPDYELMLGFISDRGKYFVALGKAPAVDMGTIYTI